MKFLIRLCPSRYVLLNRQSREIKRNIQPAGDRPATVGQLR